MSCEVHLLRHIRKHRPKSPRKTRILLHRIVQRKSPTSNPSCGQLCDGGTPDQGRIDVVADDAEVFEIGQEVRGMGVLDIGCQIEGGVQRVETGEVAVVEGGDEERESPPTVGCQIFEQVDQKGIGIGAGCVFDFDIQGHGVLGAEGEDFGECGDWLWMDRGRFDETDSDRFKRIVCDKPTGGIDFGEKGGVESVDALWAGERSASIDVGGALHGLIVEDHECPIRSRLNIQLDEIKVPHRSDKCRKGVFWMKRSKATVGTSQVLFVSCLVEMHVTRLDDFSLIVS